MVKERDWHGVQLCSAPTSSQLIRTYHCISCGKEIPEERRVYKPEPKKCINGRAKLYKRYNDCKTSDGTQKLSSRPDLSPRGGSIAEAVRERESEPKGGH